MATNSFRCRYVHRTSRLSRKRLQAKIKKWNMKYSKDRQTQ